jgi:hypothetical protein
LKNKEFWAGEKYKYKAWLLQNQGYEKNIHRYRRTGFAYCL